MGLDMYLYGNKRTFENHDYNIGGQTVGTEIGYWRKANQIHNWFVENCQGGVDDCREHSVYHEDLQKLKELCEAVLKHPNEAEDLLPTQCGFFFGSTEYDEYYFEDLRATIEIIVWALSQDFDYFVYHSSW